MILPVPIDHAVAKLDLRVRFEKLRYGAVPAGHGLDAEKSPKIRQEQHLDGDEVQNIERQNQIAVPGSLDRRAAMIALWKILGLREGTENAPPVVLKLSLKIPNLETQNSAVRRIVANTNVGIAVD